MLLQSVLADGDVASALDAGQPWYAPRVTTVAPGMTVLDAPPLVPYNRPAIIPSFPDAGGGNSTGGLGIDPNYVTVPVPAAVPAPVATPPQGCSSCGAPPIVAVPVPNAVQTLTAANVTPAAATANLQALLQQYPWLWIVVGILALLVLRGVFK